MSGSSRASPTLGTLAGDGRALLYYRCSGTPHIVVHMAEWQYESSLVGAGHRQIHRRLLPKTLTHGEFEHELNFDSHE